LRREEMTLLQTLRPFNAVKFTRQTMAVCDDMLFDLLKASRELGIWKEHGCEMVQVSNSDVVLHVWKNWYPLWRINRYEECLIGRYRVTEGLHPVTIQCVVDQRPPWSLVSCPCNGGSAEFVEAVREALVKAGFKVDPGVVNFEGA